MKKTPKELAKRYPYMFEGKNLGLGIARGWMPLFETLCQQIDSVLGNDKLGFHWVQIKEKFGSARFYWETDQHAPIRMDIFGSGGVVSLQPKIEEPDQERRTALSAISELVFAAEKETKKACIVCGQQPAKATAQGGYVLVLCEQHAQAWSQDTDLQPSPWFDAKDELPRRRYQDGD